MKRIMVIALFLFVGSALAGPSASLTGQLLEQYYGIQKSLAADSTNGVSQSAATIEKLSRAAAAKESKTELTAIAEAAAKLKTNDLKIARTEFGGLSDTVIAYLKNSGGTRNPPYQFYCSMVKKNWLQPDKQTRNPYYGSSMLTCGELVQ